MNKLNQLKQFIIAHPIYLLIVGVILLVVLFKILKPKIKGYIGERTVRFFFLFLGKKEYKIINNIHVFYNGMMSQIDHVIISTYGVFVIETKNYKGWIFGSENAYEWTQVIFNNRYKFYNPLRQNLGHVRALKSHLTNFPQLDYFPIVVFTGGAKLKVNTTFPVVKVFSLIKTIKNVKEEIISIGTRDQIYDLLLMANGNKPNIVPKKFEQISQPINNNSCPICHSPLRLRQGKYSKFYGCSRYPSCTYTKNIK